MRYLDTNLSDNERLLELKKFKEQLLSEISMFYRKSETITLFEIDLEYIIGKTINFTLEDTLQKMKNK